MKGWPFTVSDERFDKMDIQEAVMDWVDEHPSEYVAEGTVSAQAIDATLRYVVEWLRERGNLGTAELLEVLGEIDNG